MTDRSRLCSAQRLTLPGQCEQDAERFLASLDAGGVGGGAAMMRMGAVVPRIRETYYAELMKAEQLSRIKAGTLSAEALNSWKVEERIRIAKMLRRQQGLLPSVILELRDRQVYGAGGRTVDNLVRRKIASAAGKGMVLDRAWAVAALGASWNAPNPEVTKAARAARYLKHGGRVFFVVGLGASAHSIVTAPEEERLRVAAREGVGIAGGALGTSLAVGLVIGFGVVTGGWGLIAVGLVGGLSGGLAAEYGAERLFFASDSPAVETQLEQTGMVHQGLLSKHLPLR